MIYLKACPRCRGDMNVSRDMYGDYHQCIQCGYIVDLEQDTLLQARLTQDQARLVPSEGKVA